MATGMAQITNTVEWGFWARSCVNQTRSLTWGLEMAQMGQTEHWGSVWVHQHTHRNQWVPGWKERNLNPNKKKIQTLVWVAGETTLMLVLVPPVSQNCITRVSPDVWSGWTETNGSSTYIYTHMNGRFSIIDKEKRVWGTWEEPPRFPHVERWSEDRLWWWKKTPSPPTFYSTWGSLVVPLTSLTLSSLYQWC